ncbi:TAXI family TRAP transporter solute-binding subunit [Thermodesulfobacteriota bacterium]
MKIRALILVVVAGLIFQPGPHDSQAAPRFVTIGSGDSAGVYFPIGLAIAKMLNGRRQEYGIRVTVEATQGSVFNINAITAGHLEFGLAQSNKQYQAVKGLAEWSKKGPQTELRSVFSLHHEFVNLVVAMDADAKALAELKGKRVNIGNKGSGQHQDAINALLAQGLNPEKDIFPEIVSTSKAIDLLQDYRIDAFFCTLGHPSEILLSATSGNRMVRFVPLTGPGIDQLIRTREYYTKASIPVAQFYPGAQGPAEVETFSVVATLCTSSRVSTDVVYAITKEVTNNLDTLKKQHPALADWTVKTMRSGLSAPLHPGAIKYFKEAGLIN